MHAARFLGSVMSAVDPSCRHGQLIAEPAQQAHLVRSHNQLLTVAAVQRAAM
jgi:hypothetical protein